MKNNKKEPTKSEMIKVLDKLFGNNVKVVWTSGCEICENCKQGKVCAERIKEDKMKGCSHPIK